MKTTEGTTEIRGAATPRNAGDTPRERNGGPRERRQTPGTPAAERSEKTVDEKVDETSEASFPASDAPAWTSAHVCG